MKSRTTAQFWQCFAKLPKPIQRKAYRAYRIWQSDPSAKGLFFKRVTDISDPLYSVRIDMNYRALGLLEGDTIYWIWIGGHAEYDRILAG